VGRDAPLKARMAAAKGLLPVQPHEMIAMAYVLVGDQDPAVSKAARETLVEVPVGKLVGALSQETHPKILEFLVENRTGDALLLERALGIRGANDRTACLVARYAPEKLVELVIANQQRLLMTPSMYLQLLENPGATEDQKQRVASFLRLHKSLPKAPVAPPKAKDAEPKPPKPAALPPKPAAPIRASAADLEAEIEAAMLGQASTLTQPEVFEPIKLEMFDLDDLEQEEDGLGEFEFGFKDEQQDFSWDMLKEPDGDVEEDANESLDKRLRNMTVGQKIKLAYMGSVTVRRLLVRDSNKLVAGAVVKSGRMTENEVIKAAGNANLHTDLLRELARNKSAMRKYPVKLAMVNNPKTPIPVALKFIGALHKSDLRALGNSRSVPSVVFNTAARLYRKKYQQGD
jgi:hypothetical protein